MFGNGPLALLYVSLFLWTGVCSCLGLRCGLGALSPWVAAGVCGAAFVMLAAALTLRSSLVDLFRDLRPNERVAALFVHMAIFFSPRFVVHEGGWILSFVALNAPLALTCAGQKAWRRLLLNNNLIVLGALMAYSLPSVLVWLVLLFTAVMWVVVAIFDHFGSVLERAEQTASGMGGMIGAVTVRQTVFALAIGAPVVAATLWLGPEAGSVPLGSGLTAESMDYRRAEPLSGDDYWELAKATAFLVLATLLCIAMIRYMNRRRALQGALPLGAEIDAGATGQMVMGDAEPVRPVPTRIDGARERVIALFQEFCVGMARMGRERPPHQTAREYVDSLKDLTPSSRFALRLVGVFEDARYGFVNLRDTDVTQFQKDLEALRLSGARELASRNH